ncbi:MAG: class I SAM-dependent methyltransferase [Anaerolineales bacterium]|nr:class I SAM-dependent methyltransferase [Anaerolineales bacterium]
MDKHLRNLILSYDRAADERDEFEAFDWKKDLRWKFLSALNKEGRSKLIDIGAGTGIHAKFFQDQGIDVTCFDLSPALIEKCIEKGLTSYVMNVLDMSSIVQVYDSAFALNSLFHVPLKLLPKALFNMSNILESDGLLFWGQYGGERREGVYQDDNYQPKRFFSLLNDEQMHEMASMKFTIESFDRVELEDLAPLYFQSMLLRVKPKPQ